MTEKKLNKLYYLRKRIKRLEKKIEEMDDETGVGSVNLDGMPHSHSGKSIEEQIVIKKDELNRKLKKEQLKAVKEETKITNYIATVEDEEVKLIMEMRFIDNEVWEKIAEELYCDPRTAARKMRKYLKTH